MIDRYEHSFFSSKFYIYIYIYRLKEKHARYESHKEFLTRCISEKLVPNGLKLELERTIGNHDQEFLDNSNERHCNFL